MDRENQLYRKFLDNKEDYSPFVVHLTRDSHDGFTGIVPADVVLETILDERTLKAYKFSCLFSEKIKLLPIQLQRLFEVVCLTETPIDKLKTFFEVPNPNFAYKPYGLVFDKEFIRANDGNPVFYANTHLFEPLFSYFEDAASTRFSKSENKVLALFSQSNVKRDFHWEREWRIGGNLTFEHSDIVVGLCPEDEVDHFQRKYPAIIFKDPRRDIGHLTRNVRNVKE